MSFERLNKCHDDSLCIPRFPNNLRPRPTVRRVPLSILAYPRGPPPIALVASTDTLASFFEFDVRSGVTSFGIVIASRDANGSWILYKEDSGQPDSQSRCN